ncbi:MAG TPA: thermonuclease family protein [Cyclobacteriaceae bacterium]
MMKAMIMCLGMLISVSLFANEELAGKVITVIDGNTIEVTTAADETYKIMLHGIDCPELEQEYGDKAKKYLEKLLLNKSVSLKIQGKDRLGNRLGVISVEGIEDPRYELLKEGLAWTSEKNPIADLEEIKEKAREKGKGLWKEENPTAPWIFRRQQTLTQFKSS